MVKFPVLSGAEVKESALADGQPRRRKWGFGVMLSNVVKGADSESAVREVQKNIALS